MCAGHTSARAACQVRARVRSSGVTGPPGRAVRPSCELGLDCMMGLGGQVGFGGPWDCAAGALVVREAGGQVLDVAGGPFSVMARRVLATNAHLGAAMAAVLREQPLGPREPRPPPSI